MEGLAYQPHDLLDAKPSDLGRGSEVVLRVDSDVRASGWRVLFLADMLGLPVERPRDWKLGLDARIYPEPCWSPAALGSGPPLRPAGRRG